MDLKLFKKYREGKCSGEEAAEVEKFLCEKPEETDRLLQKEWDNAPELVTQEDSRAVRDVVFSAIREETGGVKSLLSPKIKRSLILAASILLFLAGGSAVYLLQQNRAEQWTVVNNTRPAAREIHLEDGTVIWLKPGSSVSYSDRFGKEKRNVKLKGEAYFDVARDTLRPFEVLTDDITTRVLGTMFNIKAYPFEENIQVVLTEGSVQVILKDKEKNKERELAKMRPGELLNFDKINNNTSIETIQNTRESLYKGNKLVFHNTTIAEALTRISRVYHIAIDMSALSSEDRAKHVSGFFHNTSPVDAMQKILFIHHMKLEQGEGKLLVKKKD
ncbi:FecR family protein [Sinomicrobium weinanense]|uniref:FecR domain-containing protein n=1 Tax=Sinomicrobium weinanense TaxID=2842200 RepID=A0A926JTE3_9FLAO|nr:FecR domain-containing protein [Sinomicrobium weinanense]MBC9797190.1 FecR domain-containing protein [Sinomicrobium weinanense]MBU3122746.1 FecR domain-containing protein [Sinomicrobium weinanense]